MQYKYEFVERMLVPEEFRERDKQRMMESGMEEIARAILGHYPYVRSGNVGGQPAWKIEIVATTAEKYYRSYRYIERLLSSEPSLAAEVLSTLREMHEPDNGAAELNIVVP